MTKVEQHAGGRCLAHFRSAYGDAVGTWSGTPPVAGGGYCVEVDIGECLVFGRTLLTLPAGRAELTATTARTVLIQGLVERAWPEGVLSIRVGEGCIDVEADRMIPPGSWVLAECRQIMLYDTQL